MQIDIKKIVTDFVTNSKEYPVFAGFVAGYYVLSFYYSNNFDLANSWQQFFFLVGYFVLMPSLICYLAYKITSVTPFRKRSRQVVFVVLLSVFAFLILQNFDLVNSYKKTFIAVFIGICVISFKFNNYKVAVLLLFFMSVYPTLKVGYNLYKNVAHTNEWNNQPDEILSTKFKKSPNVYYIQLDGYANAETLKNRLYDYDNSNADSSMKVSGFKIYDSFRSNYNSTLKSNASCFNMKHHFTKDNSKFLNSRDFIMDKNPVVAIFKNNDYKTYFISERPYLLMNRPKVSFDYNNFESADLPYLKDGWSDFREIAKVIKSEIVKNTQQRKFFFIEKFDPGHISVSKSHSKGVDGEREIYLEKLEVANAWMLDIVDFIAKNDKDAIIIIGADHGGYVGFEYSLQAIDHVTDKDLLNSMFGAHLAIKWNAAGFEKYDSNLKTSVNLFRSLFAFLADDPQLLKHFQPDVSYNNPDPNNFNKVYKAIE